MRGQEDLTTAFRCRTLDWGLSTLRSDPVKAVIPNHLPVVRHHCPAGTYSLNLFGFFLASLSPFLSISLESTSSKYRGPERHSFHSTDFLSSIDAPLLFISFLLDKLFFLSYLSFDGRLFSLKSVERWIFGWVWVSWWGWAAAIHICLNQKEWFFVFNPLAVMLIDCSSLSGCCVLDPHYETFNDHNKVIKADLVSHGNSASVIALSCLLWRTYHSVLQTRNMKTPLADSWCDSSELCGNFGGLEIKLSSLTVYDQRHIRLIFTTLFH